MPLIGKVLVQENAVAGNAISATKIAANAVGTSEIAVNAVSVAELATNSVGAAQLQATAVTGVQDNSMYSSFYSFKLSRFSTISNRKYRRNTFVNRSSNNSKDSCKCSYFK